MCYNIIPDPSKIGFYCCFINANIRDSDFFKIDTKYKLSRIIYSHLLSDEQVTNCERLAGNLNIPLKKSYTDTVDSYQTIDG
ncbi:hypothetical protein [Treponema pedis]|uniref:hypothetical protein n=1 Tax=Treponema pedis TaxID=409322 RepID=UPI000463E818|nr:hypothetical protein [Treponema pedis]